MLAPYIFPRPQREQSEENELEGIMGRCKMRNQSIHPEIQHVQCITSGLHRPFVLRSGEGLTSFNIDNSAKFSGTMKLSGFSIFREYAKNLSVKSPTHRRSRLRI